MLNGLVGEGRSRPMERIYPCQGIYFFHTDTAACPWTIVKSDDKKRARLNCMQDFLTQLDYPEKDHHAVTGSDPLIVGSPKAILRPDIHLDDWPRARG